jgi:hypothetical protein
MSASEQSGSANEGRAQVAEVTGAAESARNRAQSAWAISSAAAAALVAGGVLTNAAERPWWAGLLGLLAIGTWLVTAFLFISAVSGIGPGDAISQVVGFLGRRRETGHEVGPGVREPEAIARALRVDEQLRNAYLATLVALIVTLAALVANLVSSVVPTHLEGEMTVTQAALDSVQTICPSADTLLNGKIEKASLTREFVVIVLESDLDECGNPTIPPPVTLEVRRDQVLAFAFH